MIKDTLINAALGAVYEKTGQLLQHTEDRSLQREMMSEAAGVLEEIISLLASVREPQTIDTPTA